MYVGMKEKHFSHCFLLKMFILNINRKENIIHGKFFDLLFIAVCVLHLSLICVHAFCSIYIRLQSILYLEYFFCTHFFLLHKRFVYCHRGNVCEYYAPRAVLSLACHISLDLLLDHTWIWFVFSPYIYLRSHTHKSIKLDLNLQFDWNTQ